MSFNDRGNGPDPFGDTSGGPQGLPVYHPRSYTSDPVAINNAASASSDAIPPDIADGPLSQQDIMNILLEMSAQPSAWRREADVAADFYDSNQLDAEEAEARRDRSQKDEMTNIIKPNIDTVLGMEAKSRADAIVRPEDESCSDDMAQALSLRLKHAEKMSRADRATSDAYAAQCKVGMGWVEVSREVDGRKPIYRVKSVHRREISWDWRSKEPDISDARYLVRSRWVNANTAIAMLPQYADLLRQVVGGWGAFDPAGTHTNTNLIQSLQIERDCPLIETSWRDTIEQRLCLYEIWYRRWVAGFIMRLPNSDTQEVDFNNPLHSMAILSGRVEVRRSVFQRVRLAWYAGPHFLYDTVSPYPHHQYFPYVPFFGFREDQTGAPYGLIRAMLSPQRVVNSAQSKMRWLMNSRRVIVDSDAVDDHEKTAREVGRADAYIILSADRRPGSTLKVEAGGELVAEQFKLLEEAKLAVSEASGIHKAMLGQTSGTTSGIGINSLVEQGLQSLAEINDNYRYSRRLVYELLFSLMQEEIGNRRTEVIIGTGKEKKTIVLNEMVVDPDTGQPTMSNDVMAVKAQIVLDDVPSTPTFRLQQLQMLTEIIKSMPPNIQGAMLDFVLDATDLPRKEEMIDRVHSVMGIQDPAQQQQAAMAQQQAIQAQQEQQAQAAALAQHQQQVVMADTMHQAQEKFVLDTAKTAASIRLMNAQADMAAAKTATTIHAALNQPKIDVSSPSVH